MKKTVAKNIKSPNNEKKLIIKYKKLNPNANNKGDKLDVAAVKTKKGETGHALLDESVNRSRDKDNHKVIDFIPNYKLKKTKRKH